MDHLAISDCVHPRAAVARASHVTASRIVFHHIQECVLTYFGYMMAAWGRSTLRATHLFVLLRMAALIIFVRISWSYTHVTLI